MNYWAIDARARRTGEKLPARQGLTGAEKRRKRKGGNPSGGPGGGGVRGALQRLGVSIDQRLADTLREGQQRLARSIDRELLESVGDHRSRPNYPGRAA